MVDDVIIVIVNFLFYCVLTSLPLYVVALWYMLSVGVGGIVLEVFIENYISFSF